MADADDPVLASLDDLLDVARSNIVAWVAVMERVEKIRTLRHGGASYRDMELGEDSPRIIDAVATNQERLTAAAARFRRAMTHQLYAEGMSVADIARLFGVTRQRASSLLQASEGRATPIDDSEPIDQETRDA